MEKKLKITNYKQFEKLIEELENNPSLAKGFQRGSNVNEFKKDWENITLKLNSMGPPVRDADGWQKVWRDFKCKVKKKMVHNKAEINATGGGSHKQQILLPLEEAAANLMQFEKQLNPASVVQGIQSSAGDVVEEDCDVWQTSLDVDENIPETSQGVTQNVTATTSKTRKRKESHSSDERKELLQKHDAMQKKIFTETSNTLIEIKDTFKSSENTVKEIKNILKETNRYQRKLWEVEEKKMKMMQPENGREEELFLRSQYRE